jgi:hypothetical protein
MPLPRQAAVLVAMLPVHGGSRLGRGLHSHEKKEQAQVE